MPNASIVEKILLGTVKEIGFDILRRLSYETKKRMFWTVYRCIINMLHRRIMAGVSVYSIFEK